MMTRHEQVKALWNQHIRTEKEILDLLLQMEANDEFSQFDCRNIFDYCVREIKMNEPQAGYFNRVAAKVKEVPTLKAAIDDGTLTVSKARRIARVITEANSSEWIAKAVTLKQPELEREVSAADPKGAVREQIKPVAAEISKLTSAVSLKGEALIKRNQDILSQKLGRAATLQETIEAMAECYNERHDPVRKAERASSRKKKTETVVTQGRGNTKAQVIHAVNLRDQGRCSHRYKDGSRCEERRWLDKHHPVHVASGGPNSEDNLRTLCKAHHRMRHNGEARCLDP